MAYSDGWWVTSSGDCLRGGDDSSLCSLKEFSFCVMDALQRQSGGCAEQLQAQSGVQVPEQQPRSEALPC